MSDRKRDRSRSPPRRRSDDRYRNGGGGRRHSGGREDHRDTRRRTLKQIISQSADSRNWRVSEPVEDRALALCRVLTERGYLDGVQDAQEVATLMVQAAGAFSMQSSVYAVATGLCVAEGRSIRPYSRQRDSDRDEDDPPKDPMTTDEVDDSHDPGRNFGRLVVDGCCHAFAKALNTGGFLRAKVLLRFLGELVNCGLVQAQEYGDLLATLCASYVSTSYQQVRQPCRDIVADMVLSGVLRAGCSLSKAWPGGFSDLMDEIRTFMSARQAPFRSKGLRAIFVAKDDDDDGEEQQDGNDETAKEDRQGKNTEPMEDSLAILWDVVSALHDGGWVEEDLPQSISRIWKKPIVEEKLANLSSLSLPEEVVAANTIPVELTNMGECELISCSGVTDDGTTSPADRPDWSYALAILGERNLFDEDDGAGPASCSAKSLPTKERCVLLEYCKDIVACFQPLCRLDGSKVGKWPMLVDQLFSIGEVAPEGCQPAYLVTGALFLIMLQVPPAEHLAISCHRTILELCRAVPKEVPAAVCYCTGRLFDELERLDTTVASRFGAWFADHLKNTEYKWPFWKHWCNVVDLEPDNAQRLFVSNVLAELVKLSYTDRIKKTLPEALWVLLPLDPRPVCPYLDGSEAVSKSLQTIAADMVSRINAREDPRDLQEWLDGDHVLQDAKMSPGEDVDKNGKTDETEKDASEDLADTAKDSLETSAESAEPKEAVDVAAEVPIDSAWRANILIQVLLSAGQASPTHTFAYLDRYRGYLRTLCGDEGAGEANQVAMLDGSAQLWQNSSQWFCLVCRHLLESGVLTPTTVSKYLFREDNNNAIALSPFLWEVMSRGITLAVDQVNITLNTLEDLQEEERDFHVRNPVKEKTDDDGMSAGADAELVHDPYASQRKTLSDRTEDQMDLARDAIQDARTLSMTTCSGFVHALASALSQYAANGMNKFTIDPWWVTMTSYFKASLWLFAAAPRVPKHCLSQVDGDETSKSQNILDVNGLETLASNTGCKEYLEGIIADLKGMTT